MVNEVLNNNKAFLGVGWSYPVRFSAGNGKLETTKYEDNIDENINILMQTAMGDHTFEPNYGSGLQEFFFREINETLLGEIKEAVNNSLMLYEPRITVEEVEVEVASEFDGLIQITVNYLFNQTNTRHNYVYPFYINEGTSISNK